ncbi:uncharacterized protein B0T15DRAFT_531814 [Chaetomium strumarium]|uniref:Protein kinase domain-containing protein n=1 Tax=Chaetomium strumarium TaxID=1170767 RepID=A0AAJ0GSD1_9PEZI|nr:hypothetical protein B0T15DRAFT_531814 [Chaetomium strumarium]
MSNPLTFTQLKRKLTYKFDWFRENGEEPDAGKLQAVVDWPTYYRKPAKRGVPPELKARKRRPKKYTYTEGANPLGVGFWYNRLAARQARIRLRQHLALYHLRLEQTLGWGGNGLACLFYLDNRNGGPREYFVAKCSINPQRAWVVRAEKQAQAVYRGCLHVVQLKNFQPPVTASSSNTQPRQPRHEGGGGSGGGQADQDPFGDILFLEYLRRGSLHKILRKISEHRHPIPNRVLWLLFQCLIQACIALEHPPDLDWELAGQRDASGMINGQPVSERITKGRAAESTWDNRRVGLYINEGASPSGTGLVHWDIDPQNVLVGDLNTGPQADHHDLVPVLKLSDFGSAYTMIPQAFVNASSMWQFRDRSKTFYTTPVSTLLCPEGLGLLLQLLTTQEQFTEEWNWVDTFPRAARFDGVRKTAGKYSYKTNLYQMALVMSSFITLCFPPVPPTPGKVKVNVTTLNLSRNAGQQQNNAGQQQQPEPGTARRKEAEVMSYGAYLLEAKYKRVDKRLRHLVARCLCDSPADRPRLSDLKIMIASVLRNTPWGEEDSDAAVQQWVQDNIGEPPAGPPDPPRWVDTALRDDLFGDGEEE